MKLYLVRHGEALDEDEDPKRPLSTKGRNDVARVAAMLDEAGVRVDSVQHSGKLRAAETAAIMSGSLAIDGTISHRAGIAPNDPVEPVLDQLQSIRGDDGGGLMLVGHLPQLGRLASRLLCGEEDCIAVGLAAGGVLCLEGLGTSWSLVWLVVPELAPR